MKKRTVVIWVIIFLLFSIVGPFVINGLYLLGDMIEHPFITQLNASDMLGYYGTIIGSAIAVVGVIATVWSLKRTIEFTRKQIQHDRYLQTEYDKWKYIEIQFTELLVIIQPLKIACRLVDEKENMLNLKNCQFLLNLIADAHIAQEKLMCYIGNEEWRYINECMIRYSKIVEDLTHIHDALVSKLENNEINEQVVEQLGDLDKDKYKLLLDLKKECFNTIYKTIEEEAEKILK